MFESRKVIISLGPQRASVTSLAFTLGWLDLIIVVKLYHSYSVVTHRLNSFCFIALQPVFYYFDSQTLFTQVIANIFIIKWFLARRAEPKIFFHFLNPILSFAPFS